MNAERRIQSDEESYTKDERDTRAARRNAESLHRSRREVSGGDKPRHRPGERHRRDGGHLPPRFYLEEDDDDGGV